VDRISNVQNYRHRRRLSWNATRVQWTVSLNTDQTRRTARSASGKVMSLLIIDLATTYQALVEVPINNAQISDDMTYETIYSSADAAFCRLSIKALLTYLLTYLHSVYRFNTVPHFSGQNGKNLLSTPAVN